MQIVLTVTKVVTIDEQAYLENGIALNREELLKVFCTSEGFEDFSDGFFEDEFSVSALAVPE